jgi:hypothetical protein
MSRVDSTRSSAIKRIIANHFPRRKMRHFCSITIHFNFRNILLQESEARVRTHLMSVQLIKSE